MSKWADYLITGVRYDQNEVYISIVEAREDKDSELGSPANYKREQIVSAIKNGTSFVTAFKVKENDKYVFKMGASVDIIIVDNVEYLRTDKNKTKKDNLENLPKI